MTTQQRRAILDNRNEWDFSALVKCSPNEQRAAFDWELTRERERDGRGSHLRALGYNQRIPEPWLELTPDQRNEHIESCKAAWNEPPARALSPEEVTRFYKRFNGVPDIDGKTVLEALCFNYTDDEGNPVLENPVRANESAYVIAVNWNSDSADQIYNTIKKLAQRWRKAARGTGRNKGDSMMAWLWKLSCYRLMDLVGLDSDQVKETLRSIPLFERAPLYVNDETPRKYAEAIRAKLHPVCRDKKTPAHAELIVHSKPSADHVVYRSLKGRRRRAKVISAN